MKLYVVVPCYNEEEGIRSSAMKLKDYLNGLIAEGVIDRMSKIVFVNDGSGDNTWSILEELHEQDDFFSVLGFSRNYGHQYAVMAGYEFAADKCDACISIDADLQQDIHAIREFIEQYHQGYDVVYGVRTTRDTDGAFKKWTSQLFYKMMKMFGCDIIPNHADYRLLSQKVLLAMKQYQERAVFLRGMIPNMGFKSTIVYFDVSERMAGTSKYTLKKMLTLAEDGITSYSDTPMHLMTGGGVLFSGIGMLMLLICLILALMGHNIGLWGMAGLMIFLTGLIITALGVVGIYTAKGYMETKKRPRYLIESVLHSDESEGKTK